MRTPPPHTLVIGCGAFTHLHSTGKHKLNCSCFQINSSDKCISDSSTLVQASGARTINKRYKPNRVSRFSALGHPYPRAGQNKQRPVPDDSRCSESLMSLLTMCKAYCELLLTFNCYISYPILNPCCALSVGNI